MWSNQSTPYYNKLYVYVYKCRIYGAGCSYLCDTTVGSVDYTTSKNC